MRQACAVAGRPEESVKLVAISKTFDADAIRPFLAAGQRVFGENRVQEAKAKWPALREEYPDIELHLVGPLQTNKVREAVALFDVIQTVDREKLAVELAKEMAGSNRSPRLFIQVNTGEEPQKAGISPRNTVAFVEHCRKNLGLSVRGLMCIPPAGKMPGPHFGLLRKLAEELDIKELSMGMSADYEEAIWLGATCVRVGSALFGERPAPQKSLQKPA